MTRILRLHSDDNVIVAVETIQPGALAEGVCAAVRIGKGHKMAVSAIARGQPVLKFGQIIGFASVDIQAGDWVHEHNVEMHDFARDYQFAAAAKTEEILPVEQRATFQGYRRANGSVGTRNYIAILTSVNCSASVARFMAREVERSGILAHYPNIDGIIPLVHGTGCGMAAKGEGFDILKRTQWGYASHPNIGGVLLVGLGCEVFQISRMKQEFNIVENDLFRTMTIQDAATKEIGEKLIERIHWWEDYCARNGGEMNNNPSPGNKAGGLTTILEKSLGAAAKGGTTTLNGVYLYAEQVKAKGFVFMDTPGYDPVSATGQVAGGANLLAFTTGRGSAYGCKPTPSMKLATNSDMYNRMVEDMDINCGDVLDGDAEFVPWQIGATM